jgi:hypothetical protein
MIPTANLVPNFAYRRSITAQELRRVDDVCVILEHHGYDSDGVDYYLFTVGGVLDGLPLAEGVLVGGETMLVHADSPEMAKQLASDGLMTTLQALDGEAAQTKRALEAQARLASVGALERIDQAIKAPADRSDAFVEDAHAVRPLIGDDIILASGGPK